MFLPNLIHPQFPTMLRLGLERVGLNQRQLALLINVTEGTVSNWITGRSSPRTGDLLQGIARALNQEPMDFLNKYAVNTFFNRMKG